MKTRQLIDVLSTHVEPVKPGRTWKDLVLALTLGAIAALGAMLVTVGRRPDLTAAAHTDYVALKLSLALIVIVAAGVALARLAGPGGERLELRPYFLPILLALLTGIAIGFELLTTTARSVSLMGTQTGMCIVCIPLFAVLPFGALIFVLRSAAPTDLRRTGAIAGLLAGGIGAAIYALHCPDDSPFFVTAWYGGALVFCAFVGALTAPRLLRW